MKFPEPTTGNWSLEQLPSSPPFISIVCQVLPDIQKKPRVVVRGKTYFVETSCFLYCSQNKAQEHFFTTTYELSNPRFKSLTIDIWRLGTSYAINGFLRQILKIEDQVVFLIETTSIDYIVPRVKTSMIQMKSSRTTPKNDFDDYINSKKLKSDNSPSTPSTSILSNTPYSSLPLHSPTPPTTAFSPPSPSPPSLTTLPKENQPADKFLNSYQLSFASTEKGGNTKKKYNTRSSKSSKSSTKNIAVSKFVEPEEESSPPSFSRAMSGLEEIIMVEDEPSSTKG
jgi:hypothetical protein